MGDTTIRLPQLPPQDARFGGLVEILVGGFHVVSSQNRRIALVGAQNGGVIRVEDGGGNQTIQLDGQVGTIEARHPVNAGRATISCGEGGLMQLSHPNGAVHIELIANEAATGGGLVNVMDGGGNQTIRLDGQAGTIAARDIVLTQADCAEDFDFASGTVAEPGSVVVIACEGTLRESHGPYDRKVAGVISGAGDYKPGITLGKALSGCSGKMPVALSGKVFCKVDASYEPIEAGDLLVTSPTPAHAMKAIDPNRAFGAVIGKALRGLESGCSLIPILVALQ